jgi:hypothetical protein
MVLGGKNVVVGDDGRGGRLPIEERIRSPSWRPELDCREVAREALK